MSHALKLPAAAARPCPDGQTARASSSTVVRRTSLALAPAPPALRALLVPPDERARHPDALARDLAPGLCELVARVRDGHVQIPTASELAADGLGPAALFHRARLGTCSQRLAFSLAAPGPGVHAYMLGGPGEPDTAAAVFELEALLGQAPGPVGTVVAVPSRGTALFVAPGARRLRRSLVAWGLRQFWCAEREAAPVRLGETLQFLAAWARDAHRGLPGPISPALYWHHHGKLSLLADLSLERLPRELARLVACGG